MRKSETNVIRVALVGCGKAKRGAAAPARELYCGGLFRARRDHVEREEEAERLRSWWIVSALYGLVDPCERLRPYDRTMSDLRPVDRAAWGLDVAHHLLDELAAEVGEDVDPLDVVVELHVGHDYAEPLGRVLEAVGIRCEMPTAGMGIGTQLAWYAERRVGVPA